MKPAAYINTNPDVKTALDTNAMNKNMANTPTAIEEKVPNTINAPQNVNRNVETTNMIKHASGSETNVNATPKNKDAIG